MNNIIDSELQEILASRSASYTFLARVYRQEPTAELLQSLVTAANADPDPVSQGDHDLNAYLRGLQGQDLSALADELATEYAGLFLNAGKHPVYPFESVYTSSERLLMQQAYTQVTHEYRQAGLERARDFNEPEDHIALELEFMAHLGRQSLAALQAGNPAACLDYLEKQNNFVHQHLLAWVPQFTQDVIHAAGSEFFKSVAQVTNELVNAERETLPELIAQVRAID